MTLIPTTEYQYWPRLSPRSILVFSGGYQAISITFIVNNYKISTLCARLLVVRCFFVFFLCFFFFFAVVVFLCVCLLFFMFLSGRCCMHAFTLKQHCFMNYPGGMARRIN